MRLKQWVVLLQKMKSHNCNVVCIQIEKCALARYEIMFAHTVAEMRLHLSIKNNPLHIFTFLTAFLQCIFDFYLIIMNAFSFM